MPSIMSRATWSRLLTGLVIVSLLATLLVPASRQAEAAGLYVGATAVVTGTGGIGLSLRTSPSSLATDEKQREPAQQHVGPDPVRQAMVDRSDVDRVLEVAEDALHGGELLVAEGDVLGREPVVGA